MNELSPWDTVRALWGIVMSALAWVGIRQVDRIDKLEANRVEKAEHEKEIIRLREEQQRVIDRFETSLQQHRQETQSAFNRVFDRLDQIADEVRRA